MAFACRVMRFAVDPVEADTLYATVEANGVMRSRDGGESWQDCSADLLKLAELPHLKSRIVSDSEVEGMLDGHALCASEAAPGEVIVALRMGLFRSKDRGGHWQDMEVGRFSPLRYSRDIRVSPHDPRVLYACLSIAASSEAGSVYRSADVGETWQRFDAGLNPASTMMAVAPHPRDPPRSIARPGAARCSAPRTAARAGKPIRCPKAAPTCTRSAAAEGRGNDSIRGNPRSVIARAIIPDLTERFFRHMLASRSKGTANGQDQAHPPTDRRPIRGDVPG